MKRFRIQLVFAAIVLICGVSLMAAVYLLFSKPEVYINPGIVVSSPAPTASPISPITSRHMAGSYSLFRHTSYGYSSSYHASSSASSMPAGRGLYLHSSAEVHSVGGGGSGTIGLATSSGSGSSRGISYTQGGGVTMPMTSFLAVASTRQIAQPEAQEAPQMARMASPRRAPGPPTITDLEEGQENHQLVETPVGSTAIPLLLFAIGYIVYRRKRLAA